MNKYGIIGMIFALVCISTAYGTNGVYCAVDNQEIVIQRNVQFENSEFLGLNGYYTHGQQLKAQKAQVADDETKETNRLLREILTKLLQERNNNNTPATPTPQPPAPVDDGYTPTERKVLAIFKESCAKCHGDTKADGGLVLVKEGKLFKEATPKNLTNAVLVHHRVNGVGLKAEDGEARMPKGSPALEDEKVETIRLWLVELAKSIK